MGKDWSTWYTVLVLLTALVALGEIAWFLWGDDDRVVEHLLEYHRRV